MGDFDDAGLMVFADAVLVEVDVFGAFECDGGGPVDGGFVIVVDGDAFSRVGKAEVDCVVFVRRSLTHSRVALISATQELFAV